MKSKEIRQRAKDHKCEGYTFKDVSEFLGISYDFVRNLCNYKVAIHVKKSGRRRKITKANVVNIKRAIVRFSNLAEKVTRPKIKESCQLNVSTKTVQRHLCQIQKIKEPDRFEPEPQRLLNSYMFQVDHQKSQLESNYFFR